ncbi:IclR family transcriptional regulator [Thermodesulfobacteriota bacterium]
MSETQKISSLNKAIDILLCVCKGFTRITDIERNLHYNKTTVYRVLNTFLEKGMIYKDPDTRQYFPGHYLYELLSEPFKTHQVLTHSTLSEMEALRDIIGESIALSIPIGFNRFLLHAVYTSDNIRFFSKLGSIGPLYDGVAGRTLLSQFQEHELEIMFKNISLRSANPDTPKDYNTLKKEIKKIRKQQYGFSARADRDGVMAAAVPIYNYPCPVVLITAGFEKRIMAKQDIILEQFKEKSRRLSEQLKIILN